MIILLLTNTTHTNTTNANHMSTTTKITSNNFMA